jgi:hypothetical protein
VDDAGRSVAGCCRSAPQDALVTRCETTPLALGNPWTCEVTAGRLDQSRSSSFEVDAGHSKADVAVTLKAAKGGARVSISTIPGASWELKPGEILAFNTSMRIGPVRTFMLTVEPVGGLVEDLSGTLTYTTP